MDGKIYEKRAKQLDDIIGLVADDILNYAPSDEDDGRRPIAELCRLIEAENKNAQILLDIDNNVLGSRKQDLDEQVSYEKHETDLKANDIREAELDVKRQELTIKERELTIKEKDLDCRMYEATNAEKEMVRKSDADIQKLDVEKKAVFGRIIGEAVKVGGIFVSGVMTIIALRGAMEFEKIEDGGGVIPSKLLNLIFRIPTK